MEGIWKISENVWGRKCPNCENVISYSNKYNLKRAEENNSLCGSCKQIGDKNPFYGKGYLRVGKLHHNYEKPKQKIKDLYRIKNIFNSKKVNQIIRYSEKFGKLYKSFPTYSEIL